MKIKIEFGKNNDFIANFMGLKPHTFGETDFWSEDWAMARAYPTEKLPYTEWNGLIPVVEKIEDLDDGNLFRVEIFKNKCIIFREDEVMFEVTDKPTKLEAVYYAVVMFILWYYGEFSEY